MSGAIDQIRNGRFRLRMYVSGKQETIGFYDTREEAELAAEAHVEVIKDTAADYEGLTVSKLGQKVLTRREVRGSVRDPGSDWSRFNEHIKDDLLGRMAIKSVQTHHIAKWVKRLEDAGLSPASRRNCLSLCRVLFHAAAEDGLIKVSPCAGVRIKGKDKDAWTYLTPEELPRFLDAFDPGMPRHLAALAIGMGVRPGELVTLRRADVFLDDRPRVIVRFGGPPDVPTKTGAVRTVSLFGLSLVAMRSWLARPSPGGVNPHGLVFVRQRGGFLDEDHILKWNEWKEVLARAGIVRRFRWYDLRHTCASWLVSGWWGRRWSLQEVKEMLGHTSIMITQRYAHLAPSAAEDAARLTGLQVTESHLSGQTQARELPETTDKEPGNESEPPWGFEPQTYGLRIPRLSSAGARISPGASELTRKPLAWVHEAEANLLALMAGVV